MKQYKLISLIICFVVLIVLTNPLVAQSKYRQVNPYNNTGQLNPYKTYKVDRVDNDRASQYSKMQSKYINNEDSNINDFYNYNTGSVTYKTNLYDTDHFGRNDELGRKYDKYYDYEAGNPIYKKDVYNTDYFVRTDNFGNKYDKFYDSKSGSTSYDKDYRFLDYYNRTDEFNDRTDKYYNLDDGVYKYKGDLIAEREVREYKNKRIDKELNFKNDKTFKELNGIERDKYAEKKWKEKFETNNDPRYYQSYDKTVLSQKDYNMDIRRDKIQQDNFYKYDRYGNKYDKFFETPVNKQRTDSNEFPTVQSKYNKDKYFRKNVDIQEKTKSYTKYPSRDKSTKTKSRPRGRQNIDQPEKDAFIYIDDDNGDYYAHIYDNERYYYPYDYYYYSRKYHPYRRYNPYYYEYNIIHYPRQSHRYYYPYRHYRRYYPNDYFNFYYNHGKWSFGLGLNIRYPYYYGDYYDDYVYYDDNDYYYSRQSDNDYYYSRQRDNDYYKDRYYVGVDKFDARKYSEKSKSRPGVESREKLQNPFKDSLKKTLVGE